MPTRILEIFNDYAEPGGERVAVHAMHEAMAADPRFAPELLEFQSRDWMGPGAPPRWRQALLAWRNPAALERVRSAHERIRPDVWLVHNFLPVGSAALLPLARSLGARVAWFAHNYRPFSVGGGLWAGGRVEDAGLRRSFRREVMCGAWQNSRMRSLGMAALLAWMHRAGHVRSVGAWLLPSVFMRDCWRRAGVPDGKLHVLPHAWAVPGEDPPCRDEGYYVFLGRLHETKGVRTLMEAWDALRGAGGAADAVPRLKIAGDGPLRGMVESWCAGNRHAEYLGQVSGVQKEDLLAGCSGVIVPSVWWEPFGLVVYEGYSCGKPVLAARSGGLPELVSDGVTGRLHEPGRADMLARQVRELHGRPDVRRAMGLKGLARVRAGGRWSDWLDRAGAVFDGLAHQARASGHAS